MGHPVVEAELALSMDANNHHMEVALQQRAIGVDFQQHL